MRTRVETECCGNCGYVEKENSRKRYTKMWCSNCESDHCFEWVTECDCCPKWIRLTETTKYFNIATDRGF